MGRSTRTTNGTGTKRDPLSSKGGKVPTGRSIINLRPPSGGSKPSSGRPEAGGRRSNS